MAACTVKLGNEKIRLESNAYSLILYQDEFKRNFQKDFENICGMSDDVDPVNYLRFLWCFAKTAEKDTESFESFISKFEVGKVYSILPEIVELINKNLEINSVKSKNLKAGVLNTIRRRLKSSRTQRGKG